MAGKTACMLFVMDRTFILVYSFISMALGCPKKYSMSEMRVFEVICPVVLGKNEK
jgi:hypothetical protein